MATKTNKVTRQPGPKTKAAAKKTALKKVRRGPVKRTASKAAAVKTTSTKPARRGRKPGFKVKPKVAKVATAAATPVTLSPAQKSVVRLEGRMSTIATNGAKALKLIQAHSKLISKKATAHKVAKRKAASPKATALTARKASKLRTELKRDRAKLLTMRGRLTADNKTLRAVKVELALQKRIAGIDQRMQARQQSEGDKINATMTRLVTKFSKDKRLALEKKSATSIRQFIMGCRKRQKNIMDAFEKAQLKAQQKAEKAKNAPPKKRRRRRKVQQS